MKLIDLLVKELPQRGGWPANISYIAQDEGSATWGFLHKPEMDCDDEWMDDSEAGYEIQIGYIGDADDCNTSVVSKQQYEAALAASKAVVGHNGWIQWAGGDCPVDRDAIIEVKYRNPNPYQYNNDRAGDFDWEHIGSNADIISYRLHDHGINHRANDDQLEQDLNECIGQGVTTEWVGDGLPPVGCECEVKRAIDWVKCKILFISEAHVVLMADEECCWNTCACQFRPLRTESERKRDAAINDMLTIIDCNGVAPKNSAIQIYDAIAAGKIPGVKLEGK